MAMAKCPGCGKEVSRPIRKIENSVFKIAVYKCEGCGKAFKVSS
jgi:DNA-directed RNA polymerase subunit RPC12/RpoP